MRDSVSPSLGWEARRQARMNRRPWMDEEQRSFPGPHT
ncbi:Hypothetical protein A7982_04562 [Minicystis rosea]|nr:Hypothetical protein A7982_04562 [Minicystis rosea]